MSEKPDPYDGLSPYGIAITALERILDLDADLGTWDEARGIASEAHGLAVAVAAMHTGQAAPGLRDLVADWRKTADLLKDRHGAGDARERNTLEVVISQAEAILAEPQAAPAVTAEALAAALADEAKLAALVQAAKKYDHDNRPKYTNWGSVPDHQAARLILGAFGAMEPAQAAPELAALEADRNGLRFELSDTRKSLDVAVGETRKLREAVTAEAARLENSAKATAPSRKSETEADAAMRLRNILEGK